MTMREEEIEFIQQQQRRKLENLINGFSPEERDLYDRHTSIIKSEKRPLTIEEYEQIKSDPHCTSSVYKAINITDTLENFDEESRKLFEPAKLYWPECN